MRRTGLLDVDVKPLKTGYTDEEVWQLLQDFSGAANASQFQTIPRPLQKHYLYLVREEGVGPRTLSRLTGVPYSIVQRATSAAQELTEQREQRWEFTHNLCRVVTEEDDSQRHLQQQYTTSILRESTTEEDEWFTYCDEEDYKKYPDW